MSSAQGAEVVCEGKRVINFCSNDYLGLANDPEIKSAFIKAVDKYGAGAGASQYICGYTDLHHKLEEIVVDVTGFERSLCFSSGYMANLAIQSVLLQRSDRVFIDRLAHASVYDAAVLSRARLVRYPHVDISTLQRQLEKYPGGRKLIITDGVFSMDGNIAPLAQLSRLASKHAATLVVDDAHGFAVTGDGGRGSLQACGVRPEEAGLYMATLGKACGVYGAFVAGAADVIDLLAQSSRTLIYTTALPPAVVAASITGIKKAMRESWRREHLQNLIKRFRVGAEQLSLPIKDSITPIQPLIVNENKTALAFGNALFQSGFLVSAIRPPTVPQGSARLRITISSAHTGEHIDQLLEALHMQCNRLLD